MIDKAFNSTRCIRNNQSHLGGQADSYLSTPHGALGTKAYWKWNDIAWNLSTPHGALGTGDFALGQSVRGQLSTPHGALGTNPFSASLI